jgi:hypothetical protein
VFVVRSFHLCSSNKSRVSGAGRANKKTGRPFQAAPSSVQLRVKRSRPV